MLKPDQVLCKVQRNNSNKTNILQLVGNFGWSKPTHLVKTGKNQVSLESPNTSAKFAPVPKLNPSLSGPVWNTGARNDSTKQRKKKKRKFIIETSHNGQWIDMSCG